MRQNFSGKVIQHNRIKPSIVQITQVIPEYTETSLAAPQ